SRTRRARNPGHFFGPVRITPTKLHRARCGRRAANCPVNRDVVRFLNQPAASRLGCHASAQGNAMSLFDLSGRVAIVTGGNGGIGLGMAEGLASAGAIVVLAGRNTEKGETAVQRIARAGGNAEFAEVDVTSETSCRALVDQVAARHGCLDILVNNAGTNIRKSPDTLSTAEWHTVIDTNLTSAFICTHAAYPH